MENDIIVEKLKKIQESVGTNLPEKFISLYTLNEKVCINGCEFMNLNDILSELEYAEENNETEDYDYLKIIEEGTIMKRAYVKGRVPFIQDYSGNFIGIDFVPGENGVSGQIINYGSDEREMYVFANSFEDFVEGLEKIENLNSKVYLTDYLIKNNIRFK